MNHPRIFYKYTSAEVAGIVLGTSRLRWSSPLIFEDVAEFNRMPRFSPTIAEGLKMQPEIIASVIYDGFELDESNLSPNSKRLLESSREFPKRGFDRGDLVDSLASEQVDADAKMEAALHEQFNELTIKSFRVFCVTTEFDNMQMWENYGQAHRGCVLGFRHIPTLSTSLLEARQVEYSAERPTIGSGLDFLLFGGTTDLVRRSIDAICYTKHDDWKQEREWRAMTKRPHEQFELFGDYPFLADELESVTLGLCSSVALKSKVQYLLESTYKRAELYRLCNDGGRIVRRKVSATN